MAAKPGSELALDDEATSWTNISHAVSNYLLHAADSLNGLHTLIPTETKVQIPYIAHFPVARSSLEASSLALWILAPDNPKVRIERHLRNVWREVSEDDDLVRRVIIATEADPERALVGGVDRHRKQRKAWKKKRVDYIRRVAARTCVPDPTESRWTVGFAEIVRDATKATELPGVYGEIVWRLISGLSHPSMIRSTRTMSVEEQRHNGDGTLDVLMTSDVATIQFSLEAALLQFSSAVETYAARAIRPGDPAGYSAAR
ncbi:hypothetical protein R2Q81_06815 [Microbacterium aquimaris]|uniref:hypothetical protein n=1 Tax=Microbacterium aquimaris TaxID=459816 RepID=UPI002AD3A20E|nr:hypothetical protein [Microbacterium aquimaris]MDZ8275663.1 hypothetical protein [Microbacterium aquimaris]